MNEPEWLDVTIVVDFHAEQLALFGGPDGIRDVGLLESALARPQNKFAFGELARWIAGHVQRLDAPGIQP
jgi:death-on-curing protein